jgi:hypothetical protein
MRLLTCLCAAIALSVLLLSGCGSISQKDLQEVVTIQTVDPLEKIFHETSVFKTVEPVAHVAKGEHASFQIVLRSQRNIADLNCSVTSLTSEKGTLPDVKTGYVDYVKVGRNYALPSRDRIFSPSGFYPDPIVPKENVRIEADQTQPVWITITVPPDAAEGIYKGELKVTGSIEDRPFEMTMPLQVQVYPVKIDKTSLWVTNWFFSHAANLKLIYGEDVQPYSEKYWEYTSMLAKKMAEYRQNVALISPLHLASYSIGPEGKYDIDFTNFDKTVEIFMKEGVLGRIEGGHIGGREGGWLSNFVLTVPVVEADTVYFKPMPLESDTAKTFYNTFIPALNEHLVEKGWDKIYMQHLMDEPIPENVATYIEIADFIKQLAPGLRIVEACHSKDVKNSVQVWVPQLDYLNKDLAFYQERAQAGDEVWFYTCVNPRGEYANRFIDLPLIKTRILHWINFKYDIPGYLHWGFNYWNDNPYNETATIQLESGNVLPGGDSWIIYPGDRRLNSSIRLEAMRDGIVDYELLKMLEAKYPEEAAELARQVVYRFDHYDINIEAFREKRKKILTLLSTDATGADHLMIRQKN